MTTQWGPPLLFWDIETTDLEADRGRLLCFGATASDGDLFWSTLPTASRAATRRSLRFTFDVLRSHPYWVTFNGRRFDVPFLFGMGAKFGMLPPTPRLHLDLYAWVRRQLRFSCRRLVYLSHHLLADDPYVGPWAGQPGGLASFSQAVNLGEPCIKCVRDLRATHNLTLLFLRKLHRRFPSLRRLRCPTRAI